MSPRAREVALATLAALGFGLAFSHPILARLGEPGFHHDWDLLWQLHWAACSSVTDFHQLPLWNPWKCGGMPLLANPHSRILTPFFLLHLLLGPFAGVHVEIPLHLAIAWGGGYLLGRIEGLGPLAAVVAASVFPGSSWFALHLAAGHVVYLPSLYLPWIAALFCLAVARRRLLPAALAGALVALSLGEGGVYPVPQAVLLIGLLALVAIVARRTLWPATLAVAVGVFAIGFAAPKLLPAWELLRSHPRRPAGIEAHALGELATALVSRDQDLYRGGGSLGFHEYGAYVGWLAAALAVLGAASSPRRALPWIVAGATFFLLAMGDALGAASPWALLHRLPVFEAERAAPRFLIPLTLAIGVLAGLGVEALRSRSGAGRLLAAALAVALVIDLWSVGPPNLRYVFGGAQATRPPSPEFQQAGTAAATREMLSFSRANMGAVDCYEYTPFRTRVRGADEAGYRGEAYLLGPGSVRLLEWTPNALRYEVDAGEPTVLVVNQNHDPGWRLAEGDGELFVDDGLLAVRLPAGRRRVALVYRCPLFWIGVAIASLSGVALLATTRLRA